MLLSQPTAICLPLAHTHTHRQADIHTHTTNSLGMTIRGHAVRETHIMTGQSDHNSQLMEHAVNSYSISFSYTQTHTYTHWQSDKKRLVSFFTGLENKVIYQVPFFPCLLGISKIIQGSWTTLRGYKSTKAAQSSADNVEAQLNKLKCKTWCVLLVIAGLLCLPSYGVQKISLIIR